MQSFYPERIERIMGCTESEWLAWLPRAVAPWQHEQAPGEASVAVGNGRLRLQWQALDPMVLGLIRMPRLRMRFEFSGLDDEARRAFMKRFDLYTQRGGG